jgi:outer membrane biosynthesis protein TonB
MSPGWRISPALLAAIAAGALSFGVCFAVVADATRTAAPDRIAARPARQAAQASLALTRAPSLRVRTGVLPAPAPPAPPPRRTIKAASGPATQDTGVPPADETQPTQTTTTTPAQPIATPKPTPTQKPKAKPKPKPKPQPTGPDFDESGPQEPPSGGSG